MPDLLSSYNYPPERAKWPAISGLVVGTVLLARTLPTSFAFDRVVHTAIATLACSGLAVVGLSRCLPAHDVASAGLTPLGTTAAIPWSEVGRPHASRHHSPSRPDEAQSVPPRRLRLLFISLVLALCSRVEVLRATVRNVQCATLTGEPLVPLALAALDYWTAVRSKRTIDPDGLSRRDAFFRPSPALFCAPCIAAVLGLGGMLALGSTANPPSTVICASVLPHSWLVPLLQHVGSALDVVILYCTSRLLLLHDTRRPQSLGLRFASVGYAFCSSAAVLLTIGWMYFFIQDHDRQWILTIPSLYFWSVLKLILVVAFTLSCALVCSAILGVVTTSLLTTFTSIMTVATSSALAVIPQFPPQSLGLAFLGICLSVLAFVLYAHFTTFFVENAQPGSKKSSKLVHLLINLILSMLVVVWASIWTSHVGTATYHPIDRLIYEAQSHHMQYADQVSTSKTLTDAVNEYERRYRRHPPPGFDHWYKFATDRDSAIIDGFDGIHRDLQPFFALSPQEIRGRTCELISNPWNDAAGIIIRNGTVAVAPNVIATHRWMIDGLAQMIGKFAQYLPDMDVAFNLNDESRVAVPFEEIEEMKRAAENHKNDARLDRDTLSFSNARADQWTAIPEIPSDSSRLQEISWQNIFHRYGVSGCHPRLSARTQRLWDISHLCVKCASPQSLGAFLSNWTIAADICHQPDLADLHGLYLSPAAFKGTHELYPIFSQSKVHGFNDILYPSAWNYLENARYAPTAEYPDASFAEKDDVLYWRGATSEGVSKGHGSWKGMTRQRFVHMANNINNTSPSQVLLLPTKDSRRLEYKTIPSSKLTEILPTDIHIVDMIVRCAGPDCGHQDREFQPLAPKTDFQSHWKYKYLLDMDGAGFSGRFLSFLKSRSLPFKTALFREWWDDRVTPWLHFVPLDLRGQGFWATYAYFHGLKGDLGKGIGDVSLVAHTREAEGIAMEGRRWAEKALRKEDMEIYFFRLLLEWGRMTDDKRDRLGFAA